MPNIIALKILTGKPFFRLFILVSYIAIKQLKNHTNFQLLHL
ncbi:hypothetical protein BN134_3183 [Cronobacter dublinensis 1210]|uniref:Uncharacterized protein n=1 Tax=Cronobacter dublinensis 1210 TaxID=1208656 RepID=A0ABM9QA95_9ENTR|nr:hypothetical protein BN134_3183 [Cronobacter dublinensis 1210]